MPEARCDSDDRRKKVRGDLGVWGRVVSAKGDRNGKGKVITC